MSGFLFSILRFLGWTEVNEKWIFHSLANSVTSDKRKNMCNVHWKMQVSRGIFSAPAVVTVSKALSCLIKSHQHHTILMQILLFIKRLTDCTTSTTCGQTNTTTGQQVLRVDRRMDRRRILWMDRWVLRAVKVWF